VASEQEDLEAGAGATRADEDHGRRRAGRGRRGLHGGNFTASRGFRTLEG
jgi:hypothetical protein